MSCETNKNIECPCTYDCSRHGKCCECVKHHNQRGGFPGCFYSKEAEATYDRSWAKLVEDRSK
ncbi:hypothetical protein LJC42_06140 [Eubacteriales bacterium OttesenSCG-928-K08]|nr:hypothetical protein [Eubacteriales bacterium OttesenSCG-928-K08]